MPNEIKQKWKMYEYLDEKDYVPEAGEQLAIVNSPYFGDSAIFTGPGDGVKTVDDLLKIFYKQLLNQEEILIAGEKIKKGDCVFFDGLAKIASNEKENTSSVIGLACEDVEAGEELRVLKSGRISVSQVLVPGESYYVGIDGALEILENIDELSYKIFIGVAFSENEIMVNVGDRQIGTASGGGGGAYKVGDIIYSSVYGSRAGCIPFGFSAVKKSRYPELYLTIGDSFLKSQQAVGNKIPDEGYFYPTPPPGMYNRNSFPDMKFTQADVANEGGFIRIKNILPGPISAYRNGTPFIFKNISGTSPGNLIDGTIYYFRYSGDLITGGIELYNSEKNAIEGTTGKIAFTNSGSGQFSLSQSAIHINDAFQGHFHETYYQNYLPIGSGSFAPIYDNPAAASKRTGKSTREPISDTANGTPRISNETRPQSITIFAYIQAEKIETENSTTPHRYVIEIEDSEDMEIEIPDATTSKFERSYWRSGSGSGKVIFKSFPGQLIGGKPDENWTLDSEGFLKIAPVEDTWQVEQFSKSSLFEVYSKQEIDSMFGDVDNTSDESKPLSTIQQSYIDAQDSLQQTRDEKGINGGYCDLDENGYVPAERIPANIGFEVWAEGFIFLSDAEAWLAIPSNLAKVKPGDVFIFADENTVDYRYINGALEPTKSNTNLTNYYSISQINALLETKATKLTIRTNSLPRRSGAGDGEADSWMEYSVTPLASTLARRSASGQLKSSAPVANEDAATKLYVDTAAEKEASEREAAISAEAQARIDYDNLLNLAIKKVSDALAGLKPELAANKNVAGGYAGLDLNAAIPMVRIYKTNGEIIYRNSADGTSPIKTISSITSGNAYPIDLSAITPFADRAPRKLDGTKQTAWKGAQWTSPGVTVVYPGGSFTIPSGLIGTKILENDIDGQIHDYRISIGTIKAANTNLTISAILYNPTSGAVIRIPVTLSIGSTPIGAAINIQGVTADVNSIGKGYVLLLQPIFSGGSVSNITIYSIKQMMRFHAGI